jgi:tRNA threonylcarbamoyladenosine biosynthesis protein TsaB
MTMPQKQSLRTLSLDTASVRGSVALLNGEDVIGELRLASLETHSARLLRSIDFLLDSAGWTLKDLDLVSAGIGPGSFTGIRIGVATALGLAQSLGTPFAGVSGLDALAYQNSFLSGKIAVIMDAQRAQVYYAEYICEEGKMRCAGKPSLFYPAALEKKLKRRKVYLIGDGAFRYFSDFGTLQGDWPRFIEVDLFLAAGIGRLALNRKRSWRTGAALQSEPLYIRLPDATRSKLRKR